MKSNDDFLLQLDLEELIKMLAERPRGPVEEVIPSIGDSLRGGKVSDGSFCGLMLKANEKRYYAIAEILGRLRSNLNFTQSLSE